MIEPNSECQGIPTITVGYVPSATNVTRSLKGVCQGRGGGA